jgi:tRNA-(ms[2]io[6]A)-hydroxylase
MSAVLDEIELAWRTPRAWADAALRDPLALLSDHAHCELRAATTGQALILARTSDPELATRLGAHAAEELAHFRRVLRVLHARGGALQPAQRNPYMEELHGAPRPRGGTRCSTGS